MNVKEQFDRGSLWRTFLVLLIAGTVHVFAVNERESFTLPLAKLFVGTCDNGGPEAKAVFTENPNEIYIFTNSDDCFVRESPRGRKTQIYAESVNRSYMLSDFECKVILRVNKTFIQTLEIFESDLQNSHVGRLRFLDSFFPRFLRGYYVLYATTHCMRNIPKIPRVPEDSYDVSLSSGKTDDRIVVWYDNKEYVTQMRIVAKELIYQLRAWEKAELNNPKRNVENNYSVKVEEAFGLFLRMYFNLKPPLQPLKDRHL